VVASCFLRSALTSQPRAPLRSLDFPPRAASKCCSPTQPTPLSEPQVTELEKLLTLLLTSPKHNLLYFLADLGRAFKTLTSEEPSCLPRKTTASRSDMILSPLCSLFKSRLDRSLPPLRYLSPPFLPLQKNSAPSVRVDRFRPPRTVPCRQLIFAIC